MIARWPELMSQVAGVKLVTHDKTATFRQIKHEVLIENASVVFFFRQPVNPETERPPDFAERKPHKILFSSINGLNFIFFFSFCFVHWERKHTKTKRKRIRTMPGDCLAIHKSKARRPDPFEKQ